MESGTIDSEPMPADGYTDNPDPGQDPALGARVCASFVEELADTVQDSEEEDEPVLQGIMSPVAPRMLQA